MQSARARGMLHAGNQSKIRRAARKSPFSPGFLRASPVAYHLRCNLLPQPTQNMNEECIDHCNKLLRGEISAIETYKQAIEKFDNAAGAGTLEQIRGAHMRHAETLRQHVLSMNGEPSEGSGPWGAFAKSVEGAATMMGNQAALQALIAGEKHGIDLYEEALEDEDVMAEIKGEISSAILPALRRHVDELNQLQAMH